jgi:hypothetical protein
MKPRPYNIDLHIDELVLHGFAPTERRAIAEAVQRELTRLFTEQGIHPSLSNSYKAERVDGGAFQVQPGAKGNTIGAQVAQAIYGGLDNNRAKPGIMTGVVR